MPFDDTGRLAPVPAASPRATCSAGRWCLARERPLTGFFRNGCCDTSPEDFGSHTVCAVMTAEFLAFSARGQRSRRRRGRNTGFDGPAPGDRWCLLRAALAGGTRGRPGAARGAARDA